MSNPYSKLDQAMSALVEAYQELEISLESKHGDDLEAIENATVEALETAIDSAIEEHDSSTGSFASLVSALSDAIEALDPSAFESEEEEEELDDEDYEDLDEDDIDLDDDDLEDEEDEDEDDDD